MGISEKKKILLVTLYISDSYKQLALSYLKTYFLHYSNFSNLAGINILTFSLQDSVEAVASELISLNPDVIGFSCYVWNIEKTLNITKSIKKKMPKVKIALGGPEVSTRAKELLSREKSLDVIVVNEGEKTFKELIEKWIFGKKDLSGILGIVYRNNGYLTNTGLRPQIPNLDDIPSPYLSEHQEVSNGSVCLETMRGCSFSCRYCYYHKQFQGLRFFSMERVKADLKFLLEKNIKDIYLMDPTFNFNLDRAKEIIIFFIRHKRDSRLHLELKAELLDEELISLLSKAGVNFLEIGLQTINKKVLKLIKRQFDGTRFKKNMLLLNQNKINYSIQLIEGLPGDDYLSFKRSIDWVCRLRPPKIEIFRLMVLPGTYLRMNAEGFNLKYEPKPPYFVSGTDSFNNKELAKMENLRLAFDFLYSHPLLRDLFYLLNKFFNESFSNLCLSWDSWLRNKHSQFFSLIREKQKDSEDDERLKKGLYLAMQVKIIGLVSEFAAFIYKEHAGSNVPEAREKMIHKLSEDFLEKCGVNRERIK